MNPLLTNPWFSYPDAADDFVAPESQPYYGTPFGDLLSDLDPRANAQDPERLCKVGAKGGYTAQPLHGVWASGPYFHNGSVPTVWDVLKPEERPELWLRQQVPQAEAAPKGERGFDTDLQRAYDYERLGWKYERVNCDALGAAPYMACTYDQNVPTAMDFMVYPFRVMADYFAAPYLASPNQGEVDQRAVYNTNGYSKGNGGRDFTKVLTDAERRALIEYLKTL